MLLSVPADFKNDTLNEYKRLNQQYSDSKVYETYGEITIDNKFGSGRAADLLPKVDIQKLRVYIDYSHQVGIKFNYTFNTTCLGNFELTEQGQEEIAEFFCLLEQLGIDSITVSIPALMELIHNLGYKFEVKASTLCNIINANKAKAIKQMGCSRIVVDESINRDFRQLKNIVGILSDEVELIVNVICNKNCIYRMFHQNQVSHDYDPSIKSHTYYSHRCMMKRIGLIENLFLMNWIRPEDIHYYESIGISHFKLQGRQAVLTGNPVKAVKSYMSRNYNGNLLELLDLFSPTNSFMSYIDNKKIGNFIERFYENPDFCQNNCIACGYCKSIALKVLDVNKTNELNRKASLFYQQYDPFFQTIKKIKAKKEKDTCPIDSKK